MIGQIFLFCVVECLDETEELTKQESLIKPATKEIQRENLKLPLKDPVSHQRNHRLLINQELNSMLRFTSAEHYPTAQF